MPSFLFVRYGPSYLLPASSHAHFTPHFSAFRHVEPEPQPRGVIALRTDGSPGIGHAAHHARVSDERAWKHPKADQVNARNLTSVAGLWCSLTMSQGKTIGDAGPAGTWSSSYVSYGGFSENWACSRTSSADLPYHSRHISVSSATGEVWGRLLARSGGEAHGDMVANSSASGCAPSGW